MGNGLSTRAKFHIKSVKLPNPSSGCRCLMSRKFAFQGVSWSELGKWVGSRGLFPFRDVISSTPLIVYTFPNINVYTPPNANTNPALAPEPNRETGRPSPHHSVDFKSLASSIPTDQHHIIICHPLNTLIRQSVDE